MSVHNYTRALKATGEWNINNPFRVGKNGRPVKLSEEIRLALPGFQFEIVCDGRACVITAKPDLDAAQTATLNTTVADHQAPDAAAPIPPSPRWGGAFTLAQLPRATDPDQLHVAVIIVDAPRGAVMAWSNGLNWVRFDNSIVA